jgi:hypothetical protein
MTKTRTAESAVSEIIGVVLLISVVVMAVAIVGVALLSQPLPEKIPAISTVISNQSEIVYIKHDGGDSLAAGIYKILVNGEDVTSSLSKSGSPGTWSIGDVLTVEGTTVPSQVQIVYTGSGSPVVIAASYLGSMGSSSIPTVIPPTPTISTSHTIIASAPTGGSISPSGSVTVPDGGSQTFTVTPDSGYTVSDVLVDGVSLGAIPSYTFSGVAADHTIAVSFAQNTHTIIATNSTGGTISPRGTVLVPDGGSQTFTIIPDAGKNIVDVEVDGVPNGPISSYTFTNVVTDHTIAASFTTINHTITATAGAGGVISPAGTVSVSHGSDQPFTITPASGYHITDVQVDSVSNGTLPAYTFTNVVADHTISATFAVDRFNITASDSLGGAIIPNGTIVLDFGGSQSFTITPQAGRNIIAVMVDGVDQGSISTYSFSGVNADHTIAASFTTTQYTITASAGSGGTMDPTGAVPVYYGTDQTFTITADSGYYVSDVSVDGASQGAITSYTFTNVQGSHTISATFAADPVITASAGSGGTISPSGPVRVDYGAGQQFTVIADTGYHVAAVSIDGVSQGAITSYTFMDVQSAHTISATFAINTYTITPAAGTGGSISPSGAVSVNYGGSQTFTITPNTGYSVEDVQVDGISEGGITGYTFTNVQAAHTISASFSTNAFTITASAGSGGTISPSGTVSVNYGGSQMLTITPDTGYHINSVLVDGVSQGAIASYTFTSVQASHTISATFSVNTFTITPTAGTGGTISPSTPQMVNYGDSRTFTITPDSGYYIAGVSVDGISQGAVTSYQFTDVQATHTITASFAANPVITATAGTGGSISPSGPVSVTYGGSQTFTITNNTGYDRSVSIDGGAATQVSGYTFTNVVTSHAIAASFPRWSAPAVTSFSPASGNRGSTYTITITGTNFRSAPTVTLIKTTNSGITQTPAVTSATGTTITCRITLATGSNYRNSDYYVRVTNPDGQYGTASGYFHEY